METGTKHKPKMFSGHGTGDWSGCIGPRQEFVDAAVRVAVDDLGDDVAQVGVGIEADQLASFDQGSEHGPMFAAAIKTGEESILAV
jgi:hypothetical protein